MTNSIIELIPQLFPVKKINRINNVYTISPSDPQSINTPFWAVNNVSQFIKSLTLFGKLSYLTDGAVDQVGEEIIPSYSYNRTWLQFPLASLTKLAKDITVGATNNDEKADLIINWVLDNFPYETDLSNYGKEELWVPPLFALKEGDGDCEDGAFLVHSLLLHSGVSWERIRTYGGFVDAGEGAASGGHGWTAYRRETDDEWVVLDTSYFTNRLPAAERSLMKDDLKYQDNYFYFNMMDWHNTYAVDRIRYPDGYSVAGIYNINGNINISKNLSHNSHILNTTGLIVDISA